jgi:hypothetical protein
MAEQRRRIHYVIATGDRERVIGALAAIDRLNDVEDWLLYVFKKINVPGFNEFPALAQAVDDTRSGSQYVELRAIVSAVRTIRGSIRELGSVELLGELGTLGEFGIEGLGVDLAMINQALQVAAVQQLYLVPRVLDQVIQFIEA